MLIDSVAGSFFSFGIVLGAGILYWLVTLVVYLFTPVEDKRLDLQGEQVLDSLRTWSLRAKQTAVLTNMKLYQSGIFRYGKSRRANIIPLDNIDSIQIVSGRNYIWLALSIATIIAVLYDGSSRTSTAAAATIMLLLAALFFGFFWLSGSRQIVVRSKTTSVTVDASIMNMDFLSGLSAGGAGPVSEDRIFGFANQIQTLITKPRDIQAISRTSAAENPSIPPRAITVSRCAKCGACLAADSQFCEECGESVAVTP